MQGAREEVNFQSVTSGGGENYGWRVMEGSLCTNLGGGPACNDPALTLPILEYDHTQGCAVTGGFRYRGSRIDPLRANYVYADFCNGRISGAARNGAASASQLLLESGVLVSAFGEGPDGELMVADYGAGTLHRLVARDGDADGMPDWWEQRFFGTETGGPAATDSDGDGFSNLQELAEAGYPNGLRLRVAFPTDSTYPIEAQAAQASLRRAGFDVELYPYSSSDFWGRLLPNVENAQRGEWGLAYTGWIPDLYGANNGRSVIVSPYDGRQLGNMSQNYGCYDSAAVNSAIDRALAAPTADLAEAAWADAVAQVMDDVAIVPLIERKTGWMRSSRVRNCSWSVLGMQCILTAVWLADAAHAKPEGRP